MQWCIDLDSMHMTGVSNGGMISYYVASTVTDGLGNCHNCCLQFFREIIFCNFFVT